MDKTIQNLFPRTTPLHKGIKTPLLEPLSCEFEDEQQVFPNEPRNGRRQRPPDAFASQAPTTSEVSRREFEVSDRIRLTPHPCRLGRKQNETATP